MQSFTDLKDFNVEIKRETRRKFDNHFFTSTNNIHHCKLCQYKVSVNISKSGHSKLANHVIEDHEFEMREFFCTRTLCYFSTHCLALRKR